MVLRQKIPFTDIEEVDYTSTTVIEYSDKWVIAQRDDLSISVKAGFLEISYDNSITFTKSLAITNANKIINGYIFKNGNIMLSTTDNKIFLTNFNLDFYIEKTVYKADGVTPYPIHTPQNASFPGRYFYTHKYMAQEDENDVYMFGNYCSVNLGAAPVILVYTADFGQTFKIAYEFGQLYRDNGTGGGSITTGTLLGDPNNTIKTRHTHHVEYSPFNNKWYCITGDGNNGADEIRWMEGSYNDNTDIWTWNQIDFGFQITQTSQLLSTELFFHQDHLYYSTDTAGAQPGDTINGIWKVKINEIADITKHVQVIQFPNYNDVASNLKVNEVGSMLFTLVSNGGSTTNTLGIALNYGTGAVQYKVFSGKNFIRLNSPNSAGFFRLDTDRFTTLQSKTFLIKVGYDLFNNI